MCVLIAAGVLILGGISSGVWLLSTRSPLPVSETILEVPPNSYLPEIKRVSIEDVKMKLDSASNVVIVDTRSQNSYDKSHIAGSISIPLEAIAEQYSKIDGYDEIITYCSWPDEEESARAAKKLMEAGYSNVKAIEGGFEAWKAAGFPVEGTYYEN